LNRLGGRSFGPLTVDEIRAYFTSGMIHAHDRVTVPGEAGSLTAEQAAALLEVPAPPAPPQGLPMSVAASRYMPAAPTTNGTVSGESTPAGPAQPGTAPPPLLSHAAPIGRVPGGIAMQPVKPALGWRGALLWASLLLVAQMYSLPATVEGEERSFATFLAAMLPRYLGTAAACFAVVALAGRVLQGSWPGLRSGFLAMSLVSALLVGNRLLQPPAPTVAEVQEGAISPDTPELAKPRGGAQIAGPARSVEFPSAPAAAAPLEAPTPTEIQAAVENQAAVGTQATVEVPSRKRVDFFGICQMLGRRGDWAGVLGTAQEWVRVEPDEPAAWSMLGLAFDNLGQKHEAITHYKHSLQIEATAITWSNLGTAYEDLGRYQEAADAHATALQFDPSYADAWSNLGIAQFRLGQAEASLASFHKAVAIRPSFVKGWNNLGLAYYRQQRYAESAAAYREALRVDSQNADATSGLADATQRLR